MVIAALLPGKIFPEHNPETSADQVSALLTGKNLPKTIIQKHQQIQFRAFFFSKIELGKQYDQTLKLIFREYIVLYMKPSKII